MTNDECKRGAVHHSSFVIWHSPEPLISPLTKRYGAPESADRSIRLTLISPLTKRYGGPGRRSPLMMVEFGSARFRFSGPSGISIPDDGWASSAGFSPGAGVESGAGCP